MTDNVISFGGRDENVLDLGTHVRLTGDDEHDAEVLAAMGFEQNNGLWVSPAANQSLADEDNKPSLMSVLGNQVMNIGRSLRDAATSNVVADVAYILFKTDDAKTSLNQFTGKTKSTGSKIKGFFVRNKDTEQEVSENQEAEPQPTISLKEKVSGMGKSLLGAASAVTKTIAKEWKTIGTTAAIVGGTRWGLTALAGFAGAPVVASLAAITVTCGVVSGTLKTRAAWKKEQQRLLSLDAISAAENGEAFSSQDQVAKTELSFREFMEQNKGLLSSNIAKSTLMATLGAGIGSVVHHIPDVLGNASNAVNDLLATDNIPDAPPSSTADLSAADQASIAQAQPVAPVAPVVDFTTAPLEQKLDMVRTSIQGQPSAYIDGRLTAAANGNAQAVKDVARALYAGEHGVAADQTRAIHLYENAAAQGNRQAIRDLEYIRSLSGDSAPAPAAVIAPRVTAPVEAPAVAAPRARLITDDFLSDLPSADDASPVADNADLMPVEAPTAQRPSLGGRLLAIFNYRGFNPFSSAGSMAQCTAIVENGCDANFVAEAGDKIGFQDGQARVVIPMQEGQTTGELLSQELQPEAFNRTQSTLAGINQALVNGTPVNQAVPEGFTGTVTATGQTFAGRAPVASNLNAQFADASTAEESVANDNLAIETSVATNDNEAATTRARGFIARALGLR